MDWRLAPCNAFSPTKEDKDERIKGQQSLPIPAQLDDSKLLKALQLPQIRAREAEEKTMVARALELSQLRAREAEEKIMVASKEHEEVTSLLLMEALKLSAYQRWVKLLEIETSMLRRRRLQTYKEEEEEKEENDVGFALFLSIAGLGLVLAIRHYYLL